MEGSSNERSGMSDLRDSIKRTRHLHTHLDQVFNGIEGLNSASNGMSALIRGRFGNDDEIRALIDELREAQQRLTEKAERLAMGMVVQPVEVERPSMGFIN